MKKQSRHSTSSKQSRRIEAFRLQVDQFAKSDVCKRAQNWFTNKGYGIVQGEDVVQGAMLRMIRQGPPRRDIPFLHYFWNNANNEFRHLARQDKHYRYDDTVAKQGKYQGLYRASEMGDDYYIVTSKMNEVLDLLRRRGYRGFAAEVEAFGDRQKAAVKHFKGSTNALSKQIERDYENHKKRNGGTGQEEVEEVIDKVIEQFGQRQRKIS